MPAGGVGSGPADALAGRGEFEHYADGGIAGILMIAGKDVDGVIAGRSVCDIVGLAALTRFFTGDLAGDNDRGSQRIRRLVIGVQVTPPIAVRRFALCFGGRYPSLQRSPASLHDAAEGSLGESAGIVFVVQVEAPFNAEFDQRRRHRYTVGGWVVFSIHCAS